jgi:hypothetical protein
MLYREVSLKLTGVSDVLPASITRVTALMTEAANTSETSIYFYETTASQKTFILEAVRTRNLDL